LANGCKKIAFASDSFLGDFEGIDPLLSEQVSRVAETGLEVFVSQARIVSQYFRLRPPLGEKADDELDGETRAFDHGLAREDRRIDDDAILPDHLISPMELLDRHLI